MEERSIVKLVQLKQRAAEMAESLYAAARVHTGEAEERRINADVTWLAALEVRPIVATVADLEERSMYIRVLRLAVDRAEQAVTTAKREEADAHDAMTAARVEVRRFERWLERRKAERHEEEQRKERLRDDEVAARARTRKAG